MPAWSYKYIFPEDLSLTTTEYQKILAQQIISKKSPPATAMLEAQIRIKAGLFVYMGISKSSNIVSKSTTKESPIKLLTRRVNTSVLECAFSV